MLPLALVVLGLCVCLAVPVQDNPDGASYVWGVPGSYFLSSSACFVSQRSVFVFYAILIINECILVERSLHHTVGLQANSTHMSSTDSGCQVRACRCEVNCEISWHHASASDCLSCPKFFQHDAHKSLPYINEDSIAIVFTPYLAESCWGRMTSDLGCKNTNASSWGATHLTSHGLW